MTGAAPTLLTSLLERCTFPTDGRAVTCGLSGGPDSTALVALAAAAGCDVTAVHVDHGLRIEAASDAELARRSATTLGVAFRLVRVDVDPGPNLEARARTARRRALGDDAMTGHTADDQAETLLLALLRGSGATGLGAIRPGPCHPLLALRAAETRALCRELGLEVADDPTNRDPRFRRNRIRHELLPLLDEIAQRDVAPVLHRTAALLRADDQLLDELSAAVDPTDVEQVLAAPAPLAARALRRWLSVDGYPPDASALARVMDVAAGRASGCEVSGGLRVERRGHRLARFPSGAARG